MKEEKQPTTKEIPKTESKPKEAEITSLEKTLQEVISLPNVSDVLTGLSRWYNSSSKEDVHVPFVSDA